MSAPLSCTLKAYIQPFERELAYRELEALAGTSIRHNADLSATTTFSLKSTASADVLAGELAFWEIVSNGQPLFTKQVLRESTIIGPQSKTSLNPLFPEAMGRTALPNRRCLRYGPHGLHEYRGKFFPQLVRALINIGGVPKRGIVADPFSGSGTTATETILAGRVALGLDMNPLSVFMTRSKCDVLTTTPEELQSGLQNVRSSLENAHLRRSDSWVLKLCDDDKSFLNLWFDQTVLADLDRVATSIAILDNVPVRNFLLLCLSNILRSVSWQKEEDLRVRRQLKPLNCIDAIKEFLVEAERSTESMKAFLQQESQPIRQQAFIAEGDSKKLTSHWRQFLGQVDAVITSPPYATALPYLDTDRLSLSFLGLLRRPDHRNYDRKMIGNREITDRSRRALWDAFSANKNSLPLSVVNLITRIYDLNETTPVGFRRRNLPALLYKYFSDMGEVFEAMIRLLKTRGEAFVVVGNNHTIAGGIRINITTVDLLRDLAEAKGFQTVEQIDMEMLSSREIFKKNAIDSESILHFRKR
jgi:DNA modification methylase